MKVLFLKSGVPYGFGYSQGEVGDLPSMKDEIEEGRTRFEVLRDLGVVREAPAEKKAPAQTEDAANKGAANRETR